MISSDEKKILTLIKFLPLMIIVSSIFITYIVISNNNSKFEQEVNNLKTDSINKTKELIKYEIERVHSHIKNEEKTTIRTLKVNIKERVYEAHKIALSIYKQNKDKPKHIISTMIKDALREIRFNKGRGYFFIYDMEGVNIMHPILRKIEGKNLINIKDNNGMYVIKETINLVKNKKEGFLKWWWSKPDDTKNEYEKIGFSKHFEYFNWFIGTGEYVKDFEKELQNRLLQQIQKIRLKNDGYFFVVDSNGVVLSHINKEMIGKKPPAELRQLLEKVLKASKDGSGFLEYVYSKPNTEVASTKISFVKKIQTMELDNWDRCIW